MSTNLIHFTLTCSNKWKVQENKLYTLFCIRHILKHIIILIKVIKISRNNYIKATQNDVNCQQIDRIGISYIHFF